MLKTIRQYPTLPPAPSRGPLPPMMSVVIPLARTNLITNPSFETNTTGWSVTGGGASIARSATRQYHGVYSLAVTAANFGASAIYQPSLTAGTTYAFSFKIYNATIGRSHAISICTNAGVTLATYTFTSTGRWQWVSVIYTATSTATHQLRATLNTLLVSDTFYIDGAQLEAITDGVLAATTYIDGDQLGLLVGQQPPAYGWSGTPHASTSYRTALTRAGGYLVNLSTYNFLLTGLIGLGMAAPNNVSIPYTVLDGARYQRTTKPPRTIALAGRFQDDDPFGYQSGLSNLRAALDRDLIPLQQPLVLQIEPMDACGTVIGDFANIPCIYAGGLEGNDGNTPVEDVAPTFTMYVPYLVGGDAGASLSPQQTVTNANYIVQRTPGGDWQAMSTGMTGTNVLEMAAGLDGTIYAVGNFTNAGASGADYIAKWDGTTWAVVKSATSLNATTSSLAVGPDGRIYAGGDFTNADGIAAADQIAVYDPTANTWAALATGVSAGTGVYALAFDGAGILYAGGGFTAMSGVANTSNIAKWNGSAWSALGTGGNSTVETIVAGGGNVIYAGGGFTSMGGVANTTRIAKWNGTAWSALSTGANGIVYALAIGPGGDLYAGGAFTTIGGVAASHIARWNGTSWSPLGVGTDDTVYALRFDANGRLYVGGQFTTAGGIPTADRLAVWNGSAWIPADINLPGVATAFALLLRSDGAFYVGYNTNGSATSADVTTLTNDTPGLVYPRLVINGPTSGSTTLRQIVNYTTGIGVWFNNLTLSAGEVVTLDFTPTSPRFVSTFQGDISSTIAPGSQPALLYLARGANLIAFYAAAATVVTTAAWQRRYNGWNDLVN